MKVTKGTWDFIEGVGISVNGLVPTEKEMEIIFKAVDQGVTEGEIERIEEA